jgi:ATP-dependent DNA helicase RecG
MIKRVYKGELAGQQVTNKTLEDLAVELRRIEPPAFPEIQTIFIEDDRRIILIRVDGERRFFS